MLGCSLTHAMNLNGVERRRLLILRVPSCFSKCFPINDLYNSFVLGCTLLESRCLA